MFPLLSILLMGFLIQPIFAGKRTDALKKFGKQVKGKEFHLKIDVVKINRSGGLADVHTTNIFEADSAVVYRAKRVDIDESSHKYNERKSFSENLGSAIGSGIAEGLLKGDDMIIYTDAGEMVQGARDINSKASGQKLNAGAKIKIRKIELKKKAIQVYIKSPHGIKTKIYFQFGRKKYTVDEFKSLWGLVFDPIVSTN